MKPVFKFASVFIACGLIFLIAFTSACKKKDSTAPGTDNSSSFDKQAMLVNLADKVILPNYTSFKKSLDSLNLSLSNFQTTPDLASFQALKQKMSVAYLRYQSIAIFGFGPGEDQYIRASFNIFPTNTVTINSNISSGAYDLTANSNMAAKGFPALDYLLYGDGTSEADLMQALKDDAKRMKYVQNLISEMLVKTNAVISTWQSSYRNTFVKSLGTDLGSSIGFLVNQINYELDFLKNYKIAIPLGLKSGGTAMPQNCEALYSEQSLVYVLASLKAIEDLYLGRAADGTDGIGFDDYLVHLKVMHINESLNDAINAQFTSSRSKFQSITGALSQQVVSNPAQVKAAHDELVKLLVLLKTDMPSALGVVITYQDGDGD